MSNSVDWGHVLNAVGSHVDSWINTIAKGLGVAGQFLLTAEMKQMIVVGIQDLVWAVFLFILVYVFVRLIKYSFNKFKELNKTQREGQVRYSSDVDDAKFLCGLTIVLSLIATLVSASFGVMMFTKGLGHLINPQYYAMQDIMDQMSKFMGGGN